MSIQKSVYWNNRKKCAHKSSRLSILYTIFFVVHLDFISLSSHKKNNQASNLVFEDVKWFMVLCPFDTLPMYTYVWICKYILVDFKQAYKSKTKHFLWVSQSSRNYRYAENHITHQSSQAKSKGFVKVRNELFYDNTSHPSAYIPKRIDNGLVDIHT